MRNVLIVGIGGFAGAAARYGASLLIGRFWTRDFPLATLVINVTGSFILGLVAALSMGRAVLDPAWRLFLATGFVGAYTTFSTFEYETRRLVETGAAGWALMNVLTSVVAGYAAVRLGAAIASAAGYGPGTGM